MLSLGEKESSLQHRIQGDLNTIEIRKDGSSLVFVQMWMPQGVQQESIVKLYLYKYVFDVIYKAVNACIKETETEI